MEDARPGSKPTIHHPRRWVALLGFGTILFFGFGGVLLMRFAQARDVREVVVGHGPSWAWIGGGLLLGWLLGRLAWRVADSTLLAPSMDRYTRRIGPLMGHRSDRILVSICAGVGEEIFFRGALQFWLGIPVTAVLFVAIHGYLDPRDRRLSLYGLFMTACMLLLGWLAEHHGLLLPMAAHTMIDVVLLERLHARWRARQGAG